jgi:uncharacterized membrane protein YfcA
MPEMITLLGVAMPLGPKVFAAVAVVFVAGVIRGFTGFGSALLIVPALAVLYGPVEAVVIEILLESPVSLGLLWGAIRVAERKTVLPMLGMFLLFVPVGTVLLTTISPDIVRICISVFVLTMVAILSLQTRMVALVSPKVTLIAGMVSGVAQGMTGMAGPLFATALLARGESARLTRANIIVMAAAIIAISVVSFASFGLISRRTLVLAMVTSPAMLSGVWMGAVLFGRLSHWNLRGGILVFLAVTALATLFQALG